MKQTLNDHEINLVSPEAKKKALFARIGATALAAALLATATAKNPTKNIQSAKIEKTMDDTPTAGDSSTPVAGAEAALMSNVTFPVAGVEAALSENPEALVQSIIHTNTDYESSREKSAGNQSANNSSWDGSILNPNDGLIDGPTGEETFYNLPMDEIVGRMHRMGIEGKYWEREDGVKMLGDYVMVAADLKVHPRGSIVETSLGTGIVCDTGSFANEHHNRLDIATNWEDPRKSKTKK